MHVHIKRGKIINAFSHLTNLPKNGVIHMKVDAALSEREFKKTHEFDISKLDAPKDERIHDLGDESYT